MSPVAITKVSPAATVLGKMLNQTKTLPPVLASITAQPTTCGHVLPVHEKETSADVVVTPDTAVENTTSPRE